MTLSHISFIVSYCVVVYLMSFSHVLLTSPVCCCGSGMQSMCLMRKKKLKTRMFFSKYKNMFSKTMTQVFKRKYFKARIEQCFNCLNLFIRLGIFKILIPLKLLLCAV